MDRVEVTIATFNKYADQYLDKYKNYEPYIETYRYLSSLLGNDAQVLDVACGPGNISKFLLDEKPQLRIHGIDLSPQMVNIAKLNNPTATFEVKDSREISSLTNTYDAIVAGFCLPYLSKEEVAEFIVRVRSKLKSGGIFYISTMEGEYKKSGFQSNKNGDQVYIYYHQANELLAQLESLNFEIIKTERKPFDLDGQFKAIDLFIYAKANHA